VLVKPPAAEPWVDAVAAAKHINVSRAYVLDLALQGKIPCSSLPSKTGQRTHYRFKLSEIDAWLAARRVKTVRS
jgi:excisionase family DNA binding protein